MSNVHNFVISSPSKKCLLGFCSILIGSIDLFSGNLPDSCIKIAELNNASLCLGFSSKARLKFFSASFGSLSSIETIAKLYHRSALFLSSSRAFRYASLALRGLFIFKSNSPLWEENRQGLPYSLTRPLHKHHFRLDISLPTQWLYFLLLPYILKRSLKNCFVKLASNLNSYIFSSIIKKKKPAYLSLDDNRREVIRKGWRKMCSRANLRGDNWLHDTMAANDSGRSVNQMMTLEHWEKNACYWEFWVFTSDISLTVQISRDYRNVKSLFVY